MSKLRRFGAWLLPGIIQPPEVESEAPVQLVEDDEPASPGWVNPTLAADCDHKHSRLWVIEGRMRRRCRRCGTQVPLTTQDRNQPA